MTETMIKLEIQDPGNIYQEIAKQLYPYREQSEPILFVVEGTLEMPIVGIRYPGKKVKKRELKKPRNDSARWENLFDFEVVPFENGSERSSNEFTLTKIAADFYKYKKGHEEFWNQIEEIYQNRTATQELPDLQGIESKLFLLMLKWIWIQEDFNYRLDIWGDASPPEKYTLEPKGVGRAKFFVALLLLKNRYFTFEQIKKIIPFY